MNTYVGVVTFYNQYGEAVVFHNEKPIYIYGAILNEQISYEILKEFKTYGLGKLIKVLKPSEHRVYHNIYNAHLIGGYDLIHMDQEEQKNFKINRVINDFKKIANYDLDINKIQWFSGNKKIKYRNKIVVHDGYLYQKNTNEPIDVEDFLLSDITWDKNRKGKIIYRKLDTLISGTKKDHLYTSDSLLGFKFRIGLHSFYQINKEVMEYAYSFIKDNLIPNSNVLDLYSGIGTIGIVVSNLSKNVCGVEINKNSYQDALFNKKINNVNNIEFLNMDVDKFVQSNTTYFENIILDPSRSGVGKSTIEKIRDILKPKRIIYMSCNPATQAFDFSHLKHKYNIDKIIVLDMFPQTYHIETIIILNLIKNLEMV